MTTAVSRGTHETQNTQLPGLGFRALLTETAAKAELALV